MVGRNLLQMTEFTMDTSMADDFRAIAHATHHIGEHMYAGMLMFFGPGTILQYFAVIAASYLFIMDRTNYRTNTLTGLLVPYIVLNLPNFLLYWIRGEIGYWVAFLAVVLKLFFPKHFPDHCDLPAALIVLICVTPAMVIDFRFNPPGQIISIGIGFYLMYQHIINAGGFSKAFAERGVPVSVGIILLFVAPVWQFFL